MAAANASALPRALANCQDVHGYCENITWDALAWNYLLLPVLVQLGLGLLFVLLEAAWAQIKFSSFAKVVRQFVGTAEVVHVQRPCLMSVCFFCQFIGSTLHTGIWIYRSYSHVVSTETYILEVVICAFFVIHYFLLAAKAEFNLYYPWSASTIIDVLTIIPVFADAGVVQKPWLSWSYLRVVRVLISFQRIQKFGVLRNLNEMTVAIVLAVIKTLALVIVLAGTVMVLEILGDPKFLQEEFVTTDMGDISFVQMVYWIFTTISTVGYGDFSPTTLLSRIFIILSILVGVTFFSTEIGEFVELRNLQDSGRGSFKPIGKIDHVVVVGGGVANASSTLATFLTEIFGTERKDDWPCCSMMSMSERSPNMDEFLRRLPQQAQKQAKYFVGNPMSEADLDRLRVSEAKLVVVLADMQTLDRDGEDESNILRALALKAYCPSINMRLMLLRPQNLSYAINVGVHSKWVFSALELKSALLAHSCRCHGWSTLMSNLLQSGVYDEKTVSSQDEWWKEYQWGLGMEIYGFCVHKDHVGRRFSDFVLQAMIANVTPIAVQVEGKVFINPTGYKLQTNDVVFAFAPDVVKSCTKARLASDIPWKDIFATNQRSAADATRKASVFKNAWADQQDAPLSPTMKSPKERRPSQPPGAGVPGVKVLPWMIDAAGQSQAGTQPSAQEQPTAELPKSRTNNLPASAQLGKEDMDNFDELSQSIAEGGGHYILILLGDNLWQQALAFCDALRRKYIPAQTPIIIFTRAAPSPDIVDDVFKRFADVSFMIGNSRRPDDLFRAGVETAQAVAMLSSSAGGDPRMVDGAGVITLCSIENELRAKDSHVPMVLELQQEESIKLIPLPRSLKDADLASGTTAETVEECDACKKPFNKQPRVASGNIFNANCLGSLLAGAFYTPGIIEVFEALTFGEAVGQSSFPWQIDAPADYIGKTYGDLTELLSGPTHKSIPIGIYRASLVLCCPKLSEKLLPGDRIFLLGTAEFGNKCKNDGILVGAPLRDAARTDCDGEECPPSPPTSSPTPPIVQTENSGLPTAVADFAS